MEVWVTIELAKGEIKPYIGDVYASEALANQDIEAYKKEYLKYNLTAPSILEIAKFEVATDNKKVYVVLDFKDGIDKPNVSIKGVYASKDSAEKAILENLKNTLYTGMTAKSFYTTKEFTIVEKISY